MILQNLRDTRNSPILVSTRCILLKCFYHVVRMHVKLMENLFIPSHTNVTSVRFMPECVRFTRRRDVTADVSLKTTIVVKTFSTSLTRGGFLIRVRMHICNIIASSISNVVSQMLHRHDLLFMSVRVYVDLNIHFPTLHRKCYDPSMVSHQCPYAKLDVIRIPTLHHTCYTCIVSRLCQCGYG